MTTTRIAFASYLFMALDKRRLTTHPPGRNVAERCLWLVAWMQLEDTAAAWNPLATTLRLDGSTDFNAAGVQNYLSATDGIAAVVETLTGHDAAARGYRRITDALLSGDDFAAFRAAVAHSDWSGLSPDLYQIPAVFGLEAQPHEHTPPAHPGQDDTMNISLKTNTPGPERTDESDVLLVDIPEAGDSVQIDGDRIVHITLRDGTDATVLSVSRDTAAALFGRLGDYLATHPAAPDETEPTT